jgi:predicted DCC family thiol-disulfide oxidoreductase YuxK
MATESLALTAPYAVFYDRSCPLCNAEITTLQALAPAQALVLIDCSEPGFDDAAWRAEGRVQADMMQRLHLRDAAGRWLLGVDALGVLYDLAGLPLVARLWSSRWTRPVSSRLYPLIVRHRQLLSRLGAVRLINTLYRAKRHALPAATCSEGRCASQRAARHTQTLPAEGQTSAARR